MARIYVVLSESMWSDEYSEIHGAYVSKDMAVRVMQRLNEQDARQWRVRKADLRAPRMHRKGNR